MREAFEAHGGEEIDTQGDSFFVAFRSASDAVAAAVVIERALADHEWPEGAEVKVRIGIHTGEAAAAGERYVGFSVHRAARVGAVAHGGQVLVSDSTRVLVEDDLPSGVFLRDLGLFRLKDVERPERLWQVAAEGLKTEFPVLRGAERVRAPVVRRWSVLAAALVGVIAAAVAVPVFSFGGGSGGSVALASVGANAVGEVDSSTGRIMRSIRVGEALNSVAVGGGYVWVTETNADRVSQIDPKLGVVVQTYSPGHGPAGVAFGDGYAWVANSLDGTLAQIDPAARSVVKTITGVGNGPTSVAYGQGSVWVANAGDRTVIRINPTTGAFERTFQAPAGADAIAVGAGALWVVSESAGSVTRIDPASGTAQTTNVGNGPVSIAVGAGWVWVANSLDGTVMRLDPVSGHVVGIYAVGGTPIGVVAMPPAVWVSNERAGTLSRIDPAVAGRLAQTVHTSNRPEGIAGAGTSVYVAVQASGLAHRGGTVTVLGQPNNPAEVTTIDPAATLDSFAWSLLILTNDGLLAYKRVGGSDGTRIVPDLAASLPTVSDNGRTYTFTLRTGIRYSTGALVRPADFRRAIERSLSDVAGPHANYGGPNYYAGIVGGAACLKTPKRCDLSKGIIANQAGNTVTFHLIAPDPDFLYKLAVPTADAVPASTPMKARLPLPATGPYMVASYDPTRGFRLVRNPRFQEWSPDAQPSGFPDEIVAKYGGTPEANTGAVEHGRADVVSLAFQPKLIDEARTLFATQIHINPTLDSWFFVLNTRLPPFNNLKARQAVNYAINRDKLSQLGGEAGLLRPSCQLLPPNLDGYTRYCPYTLDLAKAQRLVAASGTRGQTVTLWIDKQRPPERLIGPYLVRVLDSLGYKARLKHVKYFFPPTPTTASNQFLYGALGDPRLKTQIGGTIGWNPDWPSASNFFSTELTCASYKHPIGDDNNPAEFCNPSIDREIAQAQALQPTDPQAASALWTTIDHQIVNQAPLLFTWNSDAIDLVSRRVGNYTYNPWTGVLLDQLWVR